MKNVVRVAAGQGFWGDWLDAPRRQVEGGPIDYLMLDYLAEVTMSILQKQKEREPKMGYARDFLGAMESVLPAVVERGVKVIANADSMNTQLSPATMNDPELAQYLQQVGERVIDAIVYPEETRDVIALALRAALSNPGPHLGPFVLPAHLDA